jgi:integrase
MTNLALRYVQAFRDRHGKQRYYFRRPGSERLPLPGLPGSVEFMAAYQAALAEEISEVGADRTKPGTFSALIVDYYKSTDFRILSASTQQTYRNVIESFRREHGDKRVATLETRHVRNLLDRKAETPAAANNLRRMLRLLLNFAVERNWRRDNPVISIRKLNTRSTGFHTWTEDEITTFELEYPIGTRERLAFALLLHTAQRRADVVTMGRQHTRVGSIQVKQQKTGTRLLIPIHPELQQALDKAPSGNMTFLVTAFVKPFTPAGFTNWFRDCVRAAGLPENCSAHGLRKAAARRLAEAGCTAHQIMAITGHKSLSEVTSYTAAADQQRLAESALATVREHRPATNTVKPARKV